MPFVKQHLRNTETPQYLQRNERIREAMKARWGKGGYISNEALGAELGNLMYGRPLTRRELQKYVMGEDPLIVRRSCFANRPCVWKGKKYPSIIAASLATNTPYHIVSRRTRNERPD